MADPKILFVDDETELLNIVPRLLQPEPFDIVTCPSAKKALQILAKNSIDLVISDIRMPEMSGIELAGEIKEKYPGLPVILITGVPGREDEISALLENVDGYLQKPFTAQELAREIARVLARG